MNTISESSSGTFAVSSWFHFVLASAASPCARALPALLTVKTWTELNTGSRAFMSWMIGKHKHDTWLARIPSLNIDSALSTRLWWASKECAVTKDSALPLARENPSCATY